LAFTEYSKKWGCGVADVLQDPSCNVWGCVYELSDEDRDELHKYEQYDSRTDTGGYLWRPKRVWIEGDEQRVQPVFTYVVAEPQKNLFPSSDYLNQLIKGTRKWKLPVSHLEFLQKLKTTESTYRRYQAKKITGEDRNAALREYFQHYSKLAKVNPSLLNQKLPRRIFEEVLGEIGGLIQHRARELSEKDQAMIPFLESNSLPPSLGGELTPEIRAFCLLLNAVKQWSNAEQAAMDRLIFSGNVRRELKDLATGCPVCPEAFEKSSVELHHPVRDGRPPIPLSKEGHDTVEGLVVLEENDEVARKLIEHRKTAKPPYSWIRLRIGCLQASSEPLIEPLPDLTSNYLRTARRLFSKVSKKLELDDEGILTIMDRYNLGILSE